MTTRKLKAGLCSAIAALATSVALIGGSAPATSVAGIHSHGGPLTAGVHGVPGGPHTA
jgi:hypothetical protein